MIYTTNSGIIITIFSVVNLILLVCGTCFFKQVNKFHIMMFKTLFITVGSFGWFTCAVISDIVFTHVNMPVCETFFYILTVTTIVFGLFSCVCSLRNNQIILGIKAMDN
jgi:hypothetical protein